jgi:simple sugar transport system ATP-binding protein
VGNLSGGNQQKVVLAREFSENPVLLIAAQPTRGLDVGAAEFVHERLVQKRDDGTAILLVSAELDEILALSDRIAVMYEGEIMRIFDAGEADEEEIGLLMTGGAEKTAEQSIDFDAPALAQG